MWYLLQIGLQGPVLPCLCTPRDTSPDPSAVDPGCLGVRSRVGDHSCCAVMLGFVFSLSPAPPWGQGTGCVALPGAGPPHVPSCVGLSS